MKGRRRAKTVQGEVFNDIEASKKPKDRPETIGGLDAERVLWGVVELQCLPIPSFGPGGILGRVKGQIANGLASSEIEPTARSRARTTGPRRKEGRH